MLLNLSFIIIPLFIGFLPLNNIKHPLKSHDIIISILPLGNISDRDIEMVRDSVNEFCKCSVRILERILDPQQIISFENKIYPFNKNVFRFLDSIATDTNEKIIGITDIPFIIQGNDSDETTMRGISKVNGISTIISNDQVIRDANKYGMNYNYLLVKVVKHEIGHLNGIGHCPDTSCIMTSSFPVPDNYLQSKYFCESCSNILEDVF